MGPVASERQFKTVTDYVKVGRREAKLVAGGTWHGRVGNFVRPTVFDDVVAGRPASSRRRSSGPS